jgi:hypothetical protein
MPPNIPRLLWQEYVRRACNRVMDDIDFHARRIDLPRDVALELRERMLETLRSELCASEDLLMRDWQEWSSIQRHAIERRASDERRLADALLGIESRLTGRMAAIEDRLDAAGRPCRYGDDEGQGVTANYVSVLADKRASKAAADPKSFAEKLCETARLARTLVLVDPYALSEVNDSGEKGDCVAQIVQIVSAGSIEHLHLYARSDAATAKVWAKLQKGIGSVKLTVHLGDLHDRYLLAGSDFLKGAHEFSNDWHGCSHWRGVVFGASLNGVTKRPTYVLPFEVRDVVQIRAYLDDHAPVAKLESQRTAEIECEKRNAALRAVAADADKTDGELS